MNMYKVIIAVAFILIILDIVLKPRKMRLKVKSVRKKSNMLKQIDRVICRNKKLLDIKEEYITKLNVINQKDRNTNNTYILKYIIMDAAISIASFIIITLLLTMWYAVITIFVSTFYLILYAGILYIKKKTSKIQEQFPIALQCFVDEYIANKNIKNAINNSYNKMPKEIGSSFELLARELSGGEKYKESIFNLAKSLSYIWGYSFAEILIMSYEGQGDITEELLFLSSLVSEEITVEEENKSNNFGNKITFMILNAVTLIGFIINIAYNSLSKNLYFYTPTGNMLLIFWLIVFIFGILTISIFEKT
ncbi:Flp pilus assembly protein TadB [Sedimentibacter acidaminivorans]|uniref:Flp pilus assembly protein TadB n=1 Tax=Sedimentibacter acidaminivorans TaxID=913099 RepID=A0ABS4GGB9_9FIRM|nr:hypothetical protein [Sedimentibacter acidaminivorans]MBP1926733.1 Flp pilus assembly protein TadB [Sedimentibacter acidaminivorans]